jgi:hypothetical protein
MGDTMSDTEPGKFDTTTTDAHIFKEIGETGDLQKLLIDLSEKKLEDYTRSFLITIRFNEEFEIIERDKGWLA